MVARLRCSPVRIATTSSPRSGLPVPLLVRSMEPLLEVAVERDRQLERLAEVANLRLAVDGKVRALRRAVGPRVARGRGARRSRPCRAPRARLPLPGPGPCRQPSSSAIAHACSGPAPPKATSAKSCGSAPASTERTCTARSISASTTSITAPAGLDPRHCALGRRAVEPQYCSRAPPAVGRAAGSRPSPSVAPRRGRARAASRGSRPRSRARRAARRRRRAVRSTRRPRRPCARRPSAAGFCEAAHGPPPARPPDPASDDRADVGRGAAHVECDRVLDARERRDPGRADCAACRPETSRAPRARTPPPPVATPPDDRMINGGGSPASAQRVRSASR